MKQINIPVGVSNFAKIRKNGYYYIDKSGLICELMMTAATEVTLFTRPRRFGKTLGMSMLSEFFDINKESVALFEDLEVFHEKDLCAEWMNKWPTLSLTLKSINVLNFKSAYAMLEVLTSELYQQHMYLLDSDKVNSIQKRIFQKIAMKEASLEDIKNSIFSLTRMLEAYYEKKVILLIDEYDVPLAKASEKKFYEEMLDTIRDYLGLALKDNILRHLNKF